MDGGMIRGSAVSRIDIVRRHVCEAFDVTAQELLSESRQRSHTVPRFVAIRLARDITALDPAMVVCLGDSFDDLAAAAQVEAEALPPLTRMMAGRRWIWIEGNHDPGPVAMGGEHHSAFRLDGVTFRHIAQAAVAPDEAEISGHYHPKHRISGPARPCFLIDGCRTVMPLPCRSGRDAAGCGVRLAGAEAPALRSAGPPARPPRGSRATPALRCHSTATGTTAPYR